MWLWFKVHRMIYVEEEKLCILNSQPTKEPFLWRPRGIGRPLWLAEGKDGPVGDEAEFEGATF